VTERESTGTGQHTETPTTETAADLPTVRNPVTGVSVALPETVERDVLAPIGGVPDPGERPDAIEITLAPGARGPAEHLHPETEERFAVLAGAVTVRVDGRERTLGRGETLRVSPGTEHTFGNDGTEPARVYGRTVPDSEELGAVVATLFGLAAEGRTDDRGRPGVLQGAAIAEHTDETYFAGAPVAVQKLYGRALGPVARALGYEATYDRFTDEAYWRARSEQSEPRTASSERSEDLGTSER
jgi:mannose-6-phosphate isomerase-like protein (cupin superfamily)